MSETRRIEILRNTVCGGEPVKAGEKVTASRKDATFLINSKKAVLAEEAAPAVDVEEKPKRGRKKAPVNRMVEDLENRDGGE